MRVLCDLVCAWLGRPGPRRLLTSGGAVVAMLACGAAWAVEPEQVFKIFKQADQNKNAALDPHEFPTVLEPLHEHLHEGEIGEVFAHIDHDQSGGLEFEELLHWAERPNFWGWSMHKPPTGWFWLNFVIFILAMVYFVRKPIAQTFKNRHETVKKNLHDAQATHEKALGHREEYRDKLARVEEEAKALVTGAKEDGEAVRVAIIKASKAYAARLRKDSDAAVAQEIHFAQRRLRDEVAYEVLRETKGLLKNEISAEDHQRMIEQAIEQIEAGAGDLVQVFEATGGAP